MRIFCRTALAACCVCTVAGVPAEQADNDLWNDPALFASPEVFPSPEIKATAPRIRALFFAGAPCRGKDTRVFAWLGKPETKPGEKVPGIVLLHGGGGTAFESWVKLWVDRGYAAIAIDSFGTLPLPENADPRPRNPDGGPPGGSAAFAQLGEPLRDQWPFHAVTAAIKAHSLLRAEPGVDSDRIGVTGISWGGYLTCLVAALDTRLKFAIPVYGCGHYEDTTFAGALAKLPPEQSALWYAHWDAKNFISRIRIPTLWINGTNDKFFWMPAWRQSSREMPENLRTIVLRVGMKHGHPPAGDPPEVLAFADSIVRNGPPLPVITSNRRENNLVKVVFRAAQPLSKAELNFTSDDKAPWPEKKWTSISAHVRSDSVTAEVPEDARIYFVTLWDDRGLPVSTEYGEIDSETTDSTAATSSKETP